MQPFDTILRYSQTENVVSHQDAFKDLLDWLGFLTAHDYLVDLLMARHGLNRTAAVSRARQIIPHVEVAAQYVEQSLAGPSALSFLPAYYAILNLMKVYVLLGPRHSALATNRWHGASYDVGQSHTSVMKEEIKVKRGGVVPLFYESLTGQPFGARTVTLNLSDILPYVPGIEHEFALATGKVSQLVGMTFGLRSDGKGQRPSFTMVDEDASQKPRARELRVLRGFRADTASPGTYVGQKITSANVTEDMVRKQLRTYLIYRVNPNVSVFPVSAKRFELPEELPVALLFFYMGSLVRYRPDMLARTRDSRYWPMLSTARIHAFYSFLLAFWSFVQQRNYFIVGPSRF